MDMLLHTKTGKLSVVIIEEGMFLYCTVKDHLAYLKFLDFLGLKLNNWFDTMLNSPSYT